MYETYKFSKCLFIILIMNLFIIKNYSNTCSNYMRAGTYKLMNKYTIHIVAIERVIYKKPLHAITIEYSNYSKLIINNKEYNLFSCILYLPWNDREQSNYLIFGNESLLTIAIQ